MTLLPAISVQQGVSLTPLLEKPIKALQIQNAVVFNMPDRPSLPLLQSTILYVFNTTRHSFLCSGVRKICRQIKCPILLQFVSNKQFKTDMATIDNYTPYKIIKIFTDKTPFQREMLRLQKFTTTSKVGRTSVLSSPAFEKQAASTWSSCRTKYRAHFDGFK